VSQDEKTKKKAARSKAKPILEVSAIYEESAAQSVDASLPPLVAATQHSERAHASEQNGGLPCEVCGARQKRLNMVRHDDGSVSLSVSCLIPAKDVKRELKGLRYLLAQFEPKAVRR
jgi:hypothetical protein